MLIKPDNLIKVVFNSLPGHFKTIGRFRCHLLHPKNHYRSLVQL